MRETLIFLPGMMCDARLFAPQIAALGDAYNIIVPDLVAPSIDTMAAGVLEAVGAETFNLAGLSMGGIVAMEIIRQARHRVARLALLDTNHLADAPARYEIRNRQIKDVKNGRLRDVIVEEMKPAYLAEANRSNQTLLDLLIDMAMEVGEQAFIAQSTALRDRVDQTEMLQTFHAPALVLCGAEDSLCPPDRHQQMSNLLPNARLQILDDCGHISTLEAPSSVTTALQLFLNT
ncbi:MAG: alpha/beta fold hydrolase [Pseudomonadota bacterium]